MADTPEQDETETITIHSTWHVSSTVEVPKGWRPGSTLNDWPQDVLDAVDTTGAELVDWEVAS